MQVKKFSKKLYNTENCLKSKEKYDQDSMPKKNGGDCWKKNISVDWPYSMKKNSIWFHWKHSELHIIVKHDQQHMARHERI